MDIKFRFKSITTRWLLNVYLIIVAAVTAIAVIVSMLFASLIFSSVQSQAADYAQDFDSLSSANRENFYDLAIEASEGFEHKDKIEVQVINSGGKVIVSTTGFQSPDNVTADFNRAVGSGSGSYVFRGKNSGGERVMAGTKLI